MNISQVLKIAQRESNGVIIGIKLNKTKGYWVIREYIRENKFAPHATHIFFDYDETLCDGRYFEYEEEADRDFNNR